MNKIPDILYSPKFLEFVEYYFKRFKAINGNGKGRNWLYEFQDLENRGMFKPSIIRDQYIKMLKGQFYLGYIRGTAFWYIGVYAQDATEAYYNGMYNHVCGIYVITGEIATDDDGDEYIGLTFDEAVQICEALNKEAEEELFVVKKVY